VLLNLGRKEHRAVAMILGGEGIALTTGLEEG